MTKFQEAKERFEENMDTIIRKHEKSETDEIIYGFSVGLRNLVEALNYEHLLIRSTLEEIKRDLQHRQ